MKYLIPAFVLVFGLTACDLTTGGFKDPRVMTDKEVCLNIQLAEEYGKASGFDLSWWEGVKANMVVSCEDILKAE